MKCDTCGETDAPAHIVVGSNSVCLVCAVKAKKKGESVEKKIPSKTPLRFFIQYVCTVHNCGTTKLSQVDRHDMEGICKWEVRELPMWYKPKSFGGHNGDINRRYFMQDCDVRIKGIKRWNDLIKQIRANNRAKYRRENNGTTDRRREANRDRFENSRRNY